MWKLTPRQFHTQLAVHDDVTKKMNDISKEAGKVPSVPGAGYIDQIPGW